MLLVVSLLLLLESALQVLHELLARQELRLELCLSATPCR